MWMPISRGTSDSAKSMDILKAYKINIKFKFTDILLR
jgi:hypothetical protein